MANYDLIEIVRSTNREFEQSEESIIQDASVSGKIAFVTGAEAHAHARPIRCTDGSLRPARTAMYEWMPPVPQAGS